jgi:hypothetical protein
MASVSPFRGPNGVSRARAPRPKQSRSPWPLRRPSVWVVVGGALVSVVMISAGCGSSSGSTTSTTPDYTAALLQNGEQTGFNVSAGSVKTFSNSAQFIAFQGDTGAQASKDLALLTGAGFTGGANEQLSGSGGSAGFSLMGVARGATGATSLKLALYKAAFAGQPGTVTTFRISGVPSAVGLTAREPGGVATSNVYWTFGHCVLGSGLKLPAGGSMTAAEVNAPVVAGITSQNARMAPHCG